MERLTSYKNEWKREMICRYENRETCEEYCPNMNEENCHCLQEVLEKLAEYEDLEEQGKLVKLPFVVGDIYYTIHNDGVSKPYVKGWKARTIDFCVNSIKEIGKTVFLTREEAEAALKDRGMGK